MNISTWPESLLWQNYIHAQVAQASLGLIGPELLVLAVKFDEGSVSLHIVVSNRSEEVIEDIDDIRSELDVLLGGHIEIASNVSVGFGIEENAGFDLVHNWAESGIYPIFVAKDALEDKP